MRAEPVYEFELDGDRVRVTKRSTVGDSFVCAALRGLNRTSFAGRQVFGLNVDAETACAVADEVRRRLDCR